MNYKQIITKIASQYNLSETLVNNTYLAYWESIREAISKLPLKEEMTKERFDTLKTNFNIPSLGKLNCTYEHMSGMQARFNYIKKLRNKK